MKLRISILLVLLCQYALLFGQKETSADNIGLVYRREFSFGPMIHTNGFGAMLRTGKYVDGFKRRFWEFAVYNIKNPKEGRTINPYYENTGAFIYGKQHALINLVGAKTWQRTIYSRGDKTGIEIRYHYTAGVDLGLYLPVYLKVVNPGADKITVEPYDPAKHELVNIIGRASPFLGFKGIAPRPGAHLGAGLSFDFAKADNRVRALEIGAQFDIFAFPKPMMATQPNRPYFLNFYLAFLYGSKKN